MKHLTLAKSNRYLQNNATRAVLLGRTTASSAAIEGIHAGKHTQASGASSGHSKNNTHIPSK